MAFATDVSYQLTISHVGVRAMGMLEVASYEPTSYAVSGTFSVIRYTKEAGSDQVSLVRFVDGQAEISSAGQAIVGASKGGNSVNEWNDANSGRIGDQLDPGLILSSLTFDLEIYVKSKFETNENIPVLRIRDCRITGKSGSLNKRALMTDQFSFNGILMDSDGDRSSSHSTTKRDLS
jgi:hypothetical protein